MVATRCGGPESIIIDESLGILCDINIDSLAESLKKVIAYQFNRLGIRQYIIENFSKNVVARRFS